MLTLAAFVFAVVGVRKGPLTRDQTRELEIDFRANQINHSADPYEFSLSIFAASFVDFQNQHVAAGTVNQTKYFC